jgi:hypothetical protein
MHLAVALLDLVRADPVLLLHLHVLRRHRCAAHFSLADLKGPPRSPPEVLGGIAPLRRRMGAAARA